MDNDEITLSDEELFFVMTQMKTATLLTMEGPPISGLTPSEERLVLDVAARSLRARKLAQLLEGDQWVLQTKLLAAVRACALPQKMVSLLYVTAYEGSGSRYFLCKYGEEYAIYSQQTIGLHDFFLSPGVDQAISRILTHCNYAATVGTQQHNVVIKSNDFAHAQNLVTSGASVEAGRLLTDRGIGPADVEALIETLSDQPRISIFRWWTTDSGALRTQDLLFLQGGQHSWVAHTVSAGDSVGVWQMKTLASREIPQIVGSWLT